MSVLLPSEIDFSKITVGKKKKIEGGPESCKIFYDAHEFNIQLPRMKVPFGRSEPKAENNKEGKDKNTFELSLDVKDPKVAEFRGTLEKLDQFNINYISKHSKELLGDHSSPEDVKKYVYISQIKLSLDKNKEPSGYPDRFRAKLPVMKGLPAFKAINGLNKETLPLFKDTKTDKVMRREDVSEKEFDAGFESGQYVLNWDWAPKGMDALPIIQCEGFWLIGGKVYVTWRIVCVRVYPGQDRAVAFRDLDDEPESEVVTATASNVSPETEVSEEEVVSEDEEVEEEDD